MGETIYVIDPARCTECVGHFDEPQCVVVCPVECIDPDPAYPESEEDLLAKLRRLQQNRLEAGVNVRLRGIFAIALALCSIPPAFAADPAPAGTRAPSAGRRHRQRPRAGHRGRLRDHPRRRQCLRCGGRGVVDACRWWSRSAPAWAAAVSSCCTTRRPARMYSSTRANTRRLRPRRSNTWTRTASWIRSGRRTVHGRPAFPGCPRRWSNWRESTVACRWRHRWRRRSASHAKASRSTRAWPGGYQQRREVMAPLSRHARSLRAQWQADRGRRHLPPAGAGAYAGAAGGKGFRWLLSRRNGARSCSPGSSRPAATGPQRNCPPTGSSNARRSSSTTAAGRSPPRRRHHPAASHWPRCCRSSNRTICRNSMRRIACTWSWKSMRRAYRDRTFFLGDPDFTDIPQDVLTSRDYAQGLRATIHPDKATPSDAAVGQADAAGGRGNHPFLHHRRRGQPGRRHPDGQPAVRLWPDPERHRRAAQRRDGRFRAQAGHAQCLRGDGLRSQRAESRASACSVR